MKTVVRLRRAALVAVLSLLCLGAAAPDSKRAGSAGWSALERAITRERVHAILGPAVGSPLFVTHSRDGRFEVWNYDRGGHLIFIEGRLDYWSVPRAPANGEPRRRAT